MWHILEDRQRFRKWKSPSCVQLFATPRSILCPWNSKTRILAWAVIPFSRASSQLRDQTQVSCISSRFFTIWATTQGIIVTANVTEHLLTSKSNTVYYILHLFCSRGIMGRGWRSEAAESDTINSCCNWGKWLKYLYSITVIIMLSLPLLYYFTHWNLSWIFFMLLTLFSRNKKKL